MAKVTLKLVLCAFLSTSIPPVQAQELLLPAPGSLVHLSPQFSPPILTGIKVHTDNPFKFDFILDKGEVNSEDQALKAESTKLIKYFLASLTTPDKDLWVNLSPYEKDRIVPESFGQTEMGRDLLAQDYVLKQLTASLIYPEDEIGKTFWKRIYEETAQQLGTTNIPVNTFNKVWIVPEKAVVYENASAATAYVVESTLKVMLESDYLAAAKNMDQSEASTPPNELGNKIVREIVIPQLTKEVNEGKNFAQLRQVYNSLILATWYKKKIKDSILTQVYSDQNKVAGVRINDPQDKQKIYEQYLQAFKTGAYNYIKEETDPISKHTIPRKYFSGGATFTTLESIDLKISYNPGALALNDPNNSLAMITSEIKGMPARGKNFQISRRWFLGAAGAAIADGVLSGCTPINGWIRDTTVGLITKAKVRFVDLNKDRQKILDALPLEDRKTMEAITSFVDDAILKKRQYPFSLLAYLNQVSEKNPHLQKLFAEVGHQTVLTQEDPQSLRFFQLIVSEVVRFAYEYTMKVFGIKDEKTRAAILQHLYQKSYLAFFYEQFDGDAAFVLNSFDSPIVFQLKDLGGIKFIFKSGVHELIHYIVRAVNKSEDSEAFQLMKPFGLREDSDITWLGAAALGDFFSDSYIKDFPERKNSPLFMHSLLRFIPLKDGRPLPWGQQVQYVQKEKGPTLFGFEPKSAYLEGKRFALHAYRNFALGGDFLLRLYTTQSKRMHYAEMELAAFIFHYVFPSWSAKNEAGWPIDLEESIVSYVLKQHIPEDVEYPDLEAKAKLMASSLAVELGLRDFMTMDTAQLQVSRREALSSIAGMALTALTGSKSEATSNGQPEALYKAFPKIKFVGLERFAKPEIHAKETADALTLLQKKYPRLLSKIRQISFTQAEDKGKGVQGGSAADSKNGIIYLDAVEIDGPHAFTSTGEDSLSAAPVAAKSRLAYALLYKAAHFVQQAKSFPGIEDFYENIFIKYQLQVPSDQLMPINHIAFFTEDIYSYFFTGKPMEQLKVVHTDVMGVADPDRKDIVDLKDSFEERKQRLELIRKNWAANGNSAMISPQKILLYSNLAGSLILGTAVDPATAWSAQSKSAVRAVSNASRFVPADNKILLLVGQQQDIIDQYVREVGIPGGFMTYTSIQDVGGLTAPIDHGAGVQHAQYLVDHYPNTVLQIGLYMVDALDNVLAGKYDANILKLAAWVKQAKRPIYLRIGYEFDYPNNRYDPKKYQQAFRKIVDTFRKQQVTNVAFVWHSANNAAQPRPPQDWYPGDQYVDWVGTSFFNVSQERSSEQLAQWAKARGKPFMIAEASAMGRLTPEQKHSWLDRLFSFVKRNGVKAIGYINSDWDALPMFKDNRWGNATLQTDPTILTKWNSEVGSSQYLKSNQSLFKDLNFNQAMTGLPLQASTNEVGGIDFKPNQINLESRNAGQEIKFKSDPAMLEQLRNAPGFEPVIINIQPMRDLELFLGLKQEEGRSQVALNS